MKCDRSSRVFNILPNQIGPNLSQRHMIWSGPVNSSQPHLNCPGIDSNFLVVVITQYGVLEASCSDYGFPTNLVSTGAKFWISQPISVQRFVLERWCRRFKLYWILSESWGCEGKSSIRLTRLIFMSLCGILYRREGFIIFCSKMLLQLKKPAMTFCFVLQGSARILYGTGVTRARVS